MIFEYKLQDGKMPPYIDNGGVFYKDGTYIGHCYNYDDIPIEEKELSLDDLIERYTSMNPTKQDPDDANNTIPLTDDEIREICTEYYNKRHKIVVQVTDSSVRKLDLTEGNPQDKFLEKNRSNTFKQLVEYNTRFNSLKVENDDVVVDVDTEVSKFKLYLKKKLDVLCDMKTNEIKRKLASRDVSIQQAERYKNKYEIAKQFKADGSNSDVLELEATLLGMTTDKFADLIISVGENWENVVHPFNVKIDAFRVKVKSLINDATDMSSLEDILYNKLQKIYDFDENTTNDDIIAIFS